MRPKLQSTSNAFLRAGIPERASVAEEVRAHAIRDLRKDELLDTAEVLADPAAASGGRARALGSVSVRRGPVLLVT